MDTNDFTFIETRLRVILPNVFKTYMAQFPNDAAHRLQGDWDVLSTNAELFVITQLGRFNNDHAIDYYELQPTLRDHRFMDIGGDGCGNFYCMVGNDATSNALWMWEHDPYNGLTCCEGTTLTDYFDSHWQLTSCDDPFATVPTDGAVISRADHPHRSILSPILMEEWLECIRRQPHLELDENFRATNPLTQETVMMRRWPGRARLIVDDSSVHIGYTQGRLVMSAGPVDSQHARLALAAIARDLNANVF